jgi:leucyl aminopeptidase
MESGYTPSTPLEFHWYSAEEGGLLGSQKVAAAYHKENAKVKGVLQVDMTGYAPPGIKSVIGVSTDNVSPTATQFLRVLAGAYCAIPGADTLCGYG